MVLAAAALASPVLAWDVAPKIAAVPQDTGK
jgi:hypothetical protein